MIIKTMSSKKVILMTVGGAVIAIGVIGGIVYFLTRTGCFTSDCQWGIVRDKAKECSSDGSDCIPGLITAYDAPSCAALGGKYPGGADAKWGPCEITWGKKGSISPTGRFDKDRKAYVAGFESYGNMMQTQRGVCDKIGGEYNPIDGKPPGVNDTIPCHLGSYPAAQQSSRPTIRVGHTGNIDVGIATDNKSCMTIGGVPTGESMCHAKATIYNSY